MKTKLSIILTIILLTLILIPPTQAQTLACLDHIVQTDEWLSKLADKHLGNPLAYPRIVDATNEQATNAQPGYATIENPDLIEPGWKLCIPNLATVEVPQVPAQEEGEVLLWQMTIFTITENNQGDTTGCLFRMTVDHVRIDTEYLYRCQTKKQGESLTVPEPKLGPQS